MGEEAHFTHLSLEGLESLLGGESERRVLGDSKSLHVVTRSIVRSRRVRLLLAGLTRNLRCSRQRTKH